MATVRIPSSLRAATGGEPKVDVPGASVREVLANLTATHEAVKHRLFDEAGGLRRFVNVFVDDEDIRFHQGLDTKVTPGQTVSLLPAVAGGSSLGASAPLDAVQ